jgi:hypothetical protein
MNRKSKIIVGFLAAAITFGSLVAFVKPHHKHKHACHQSNVKENQKTNPQPSK